MTEEMEKLNELKEQWLSEHPDSTHLFDLRRFIRYAVALARVDGGLDHAEMAQRGLSEKRIEEYQRQYEFLREVLVVLGEK